MFLSVSPVQSSRLPAGGEAGGTNLPDDLVTSPLFGRRAGLGLQDGWLPGESNLHLQVGAGGDLAVFLLQDLDGLLPERLGWRLLLAVSLPPPLPTPG